MIDIDEEELEEKTNGKGDFKSSKGRSNVSQSFSTLVLNQWVAQIKAQPNQIILTVLDFMCKARQENNEQRKVEERRAEILRSEIIKGVLKELIIKSEIKTQELKRTFI